MTVGPATSIWRALGVEELLVVHAGRITDIARAETSTEARRMTANNYWAASRAGDQKRSTDLSNGDRRFKTLWN